MNMTKKILLSFMVSGIIFLGSCKKEKFEINSNPDAVTDVSVTPTVLLPGALQNTSTIVATNWPFVSAWMGHWARSGSYQSLTEIETYKFTNDFQVGIWNNLYANTNNYTIMMNKAKASGAGFYQAIGHIMRAHNFGILVDVYGNVPYTEAFQGTATPTPKYDKGEDVYRGILKELDDAIALLKNANAIEAAKNPEIATSDLVYAGNATAWIRFANTLRLRLIMHTQNGMTSTITPSPLNVTAEMAKITAEGFIGAGQSAHLNPGFSATKPQPYYRAFVQNEAGTQTGDVWRANKYAIDYYKYNGDPRINRFYVSPNGTTAGQTGITFGTPSGPSAPTGAQLSTVRGPGLIPQGAASRAWILTSVESFFLQAEARQRGLLTTGPTAKALLTSAIQESFVWLGLTVNDANTYIANNAGYPDVDYDAPSIVAGQPGGGMFTILSQKWFALNSIAPFEIWTDYRRTDYVLGRAVGFAAGPPISVDPGNTSTTIPRRLLYPQNEYNYNAANVSAQGTINVFTNKIFWDLN